MKYINEELNEQERDAVDFWLLASDENRSHFNKLKKTWELSGKLKFDPVVVDTDLAWDKVRSKLSVEEKVIPMNPPSSNKRMFWSIAAIGIILIGVFGIMQLFGDDGMPTGELADAHEVSTDEIILIDTLSDGSVVTLNENSMLAHDKSFGEKERRVSFKGEAFFDIQRDEEKPFTIEMESELYVRVLGTSFNIDAEPDDSLTEVYVKTGKVEFGSEDGSIILVAGETGYYNKNTKTFYKENDENAEMKSMYWKDQLLRFDNVPLTNVIQILNEVFDAEVVLECSAEGDSPIVSEHHGESLEEILGVIAEVYDLKVVPPDNEHPERYALFCNEG